MTRRTDVDVVRAVALMSMYVAHVAPVPGPAHVLELSEYLTLPLFALLVGVGAHLGVGRATSLGEWARWRSILVRAAVLIMLGLALDRVGSQVVVVLVHLGLLALAAGLLARAPAWVVLLIGIAAAVATSLALRYVQAHGLPSDSWLTDVHLFVWASGPYRLGPMLLYAAIGILLARRWLTGRTTPSGTPLVVSVAALPAAGAMLAVEQAGYVDLVPYSGTLAETLLDALLVTGVLGLVLGLARFLPRGVVRLLAASGGMTLSLYTLQVLWLAFDVRVLHPGQRDDSWVNLAVLVIGSLLFAVGWSAAVRGRVWRRGPVEGMVVILSGAGRPR